jgi:hypothetical protein
MATRCFWPPDSRAGYCVGLVGQAHPGQFGHAPCRARSAGRRLHGAQAFHHVGQHRHVREQVELLEDHADPLAHRVSSASS